MPEVRTGDVTLYYEAQGTGDPLLLIAGTGFDLTVWLSLMGWLCAERTVVAFDNRDVGRSSYVAVDYTPRDMADDAAAVARAAGVDSVDVLGWSLGGAVAQELALASPGLVRSLILFGTWARTDGWLSLRFANWERLVAGLDLEALAGFALVDLFTHRWLADAARVEAFLAFAAANPYPQRPEGLSRQWRADLAHDALDRLAGIRCTTLVVAGEEDVLVPPRYSLELADAIPGAKLETISAAGHAAHLEAADAFQKIVTGFLREAGTE